ncbi:MAG: TolC family protein [Rhodanobacteraceae bacterium]|nr:MAG: TolC family protein [Rhodanobacteraceae bacterium]
MKARRLTWLLLLLLTGCATYQPLPLNQHARAPAHPADIKVASSVLKLFPPRHHRFDPSRGLDMTDVAILAVANNPRLKLARDERGIAHAQAFAAGLLPDPVLDLAHGTPTAGPYETSSFDLGLSYDIEALLVHPLAKRAANASAREVDLNLLWMEWQVIGAARQLFVRDVYQANMLAVLREETGVLAKQHARLVAVSKDGGVSQAAVAADLASLQAVETRLHDGERQLLKTRQDLNALLGLSPKAHLHLVGPTTVPALGDADVARALDALPHRRPDLLALQAGYRSADARYRQAILEQFPAIQIGFTRARDADAIYTRGFQISLTLPIFNRNRGNVAITKATRKELHDQYAIRLSQARAQAEQILQDQALFARQRAQVRQATKFTSETLDHARAIALPGDMSGMSQAQLQANAFDRKLALLSINESMLEQGVALQALLGTIAPYSLGKTLKSR